MGDAIHDDLNPIVPDGVETEDGLDLLDSEETVDAEVQLVETAEARKVRTRIKELGENISQSFFELANLIDQVHNDKLFTQWGYKKFADWAQAEFQMGRRKAYNLRQISQYFNTTLKSQLSGEKYDEVVSTVKDVGWSKALELATENVITNDNVDEVLSAVKSDTVEELRSRCRGEFRDAMNPEDKEKSDESNTMKQVRKSFQLYLSQAEIVDVALEKAKQQMKEGANDSSALVNICAEFDASNEDFSLEEKLQQIESVFNITLVALDKKKDEIIYGLENLEKLVGDIGEA